MAPTEHSDATETSRSYDDDETPVGAIVAAVAEATGDSALEIDPLGDRVDTDALNALLDSASSSAAVTFDYCGQQVTVTPDSVEMAPPNWSE